jgi:hypothetical protein
MRHLACELYLVLHQAGQLSQQHQLQLIDFCIKVGLKYVREKHHVGTMGTATTLPAGMKRICVWFLLPIKLSCKQP